MSRRTCDFHICLRLLPLLAHVDGPSGGRPSGGHRFLLAGVLSAGHGAAGWSPLLRAGSLWASALDSFGQASSERRFGIAASSCASELVTMCGPSGVLEGVKAVAFVSSDTLWLLQLSFKERLHDVFFILYLYIFLDVYV